MLGQIVIVKYEHILRLWKVVKTNRCVVLKWANLGVEGAEMSTDHRNIAAEREIANEEVPHGAPLQACPPNEFDL